MTINDRVAVGAALLLCACGGGAGGSGSETAVSYGLRMHVDGGLGHVSSTDPAFDCTTQCVQDFSEGATAKIVASPAPGYKFTGWRGSCSGSNPECTLLMTGSRDAHAVFTFAPEACPGIAPPAAVPMHQHVSQVMADRCDDGSGDANGTLAFLRHAAGPNTHEDFVELLTEGGVPLTRQALDMGAVILAQPQGISLLADAPYLGPFANRVVQLTNFDASRNGTDVGYLYVGLNGGKPFAAADPGGGIVMAGDFAVADPAQPTVFGPILHAVVKFGGAGAAAAPEWAPKQLASTGKVFGVGVDLFRNTLVVTDGAAPGTISAQWFDVNGSPLTGEFVLLPEFTPGPATWFEVTPLAGSGLLVQRIDAEGELLHAHALVTVESGKPAIRPAPAWMVSRPDSRFQLARQGNAYAVLPLRANGVPCTQKLELVSPAGVSCGGQEYKIADGTCNTHDLRLGLDGTVIQRLPDAMEETTDIVWGTSCTWRWWTQAVR